MYRIYKADYDNVGRMAYCYSVPESGLPERADLVPLHLTLPGPEPYVEPHAMFEPTNCQSVRYAVRSFGANRNRNFWLKIGGFKIYECFCCVFTPMLFYHATCFFLRVNTANLLKIM